MPKINPISLKYLVLYTFVLLLFIPAFIFAIKVTPGNYYFFSRESLIMVLLVMFFCALNNELIYSTYKPNFYKTILIINKINFLSLIISFIFLEKLGIISSIIGINFFIWFGLSVVAYILNISKLIKKD